VGEAPELLVADAGAWHDWLAAHHGDVSGGVTLVLAKKGATGPTRLTYDDALEEALCFGWIDGKLTPGDDASYRVRFTPRRSRSVWSARNVAIAERLMSEGRMQAGGLAQIDRAKADGRWEAAYGGSARMTVPADLKDALAADDRAQAMFDVLTRTNRFSILFRIHDAKRPETRARRIAAFVEMLARGETPYPQKRRPER
jgi:uncharacterized protein YdeI (YjbR/CyaY-like superfamily)